MSSKTTYAYLDLPGTDNVLLSFKYVRPWFTGRRTLDVGCSKGAYLMLLGNGSIGIEVSRPNLRSCRQSGLTAIAADVNEALPFASESFEAVLCSHVLEHVDAPICLLRECHRVLVARGLLVVGLPIEASFVSWLRGENYFRDHPGHLYSFSLTNVGVLLEKTGFRSLRTYFEPRIVRTGPWLSLIQHLPCSLSSILSNGYWVIAEKTAAQ